MPEGKFTEFEKQAMEAKRQGKKVSVDEKDTGDGPPVVSLTEFAGAETPPPAPGPAQPTPTVAKQEPDAAPPSVQSTTPVQEQQGNEADVEQMKEAVFGKVEQPEEEDEYKKGEGEDKETLFEPKQCPKCGWNLNDPIYEPTDEDRLEFMESLLGNRRFVRRAEFMGGKIKATYRTVLVKEEDAITEYLNEKLDRKTIQSETEWMVGYHRARLVVMLQEIEIGGKSKKYDTIAMWAENEDNLVEGLKKAEEKVAKDWPLSLHGILIQGMEETNKVYSTLMSRAYDPNFWEGQAGESG